MYTHVFMCVRMYVCMHIIENNYCNISHTLEGTSAVCIHSALLVTIMCTQCPCVYLNLKSLLQEVKVKFTFGSQHLFLLWCGSKNNQLSALGNL